MSCTKYPWRHAPWLYSFIGKGSGKYLLVFEQSSKVSYQGPRTQPRISPNSYSPTCPPRPLHLTSMGSAILMATRNRLRVRRSSTSSRARRRSISRTILLMDCVPSRNIFPAFFSGPQTVSNYLMKSHELPIITPTVQRLISSKRMSTTLPRTSCRRAF